MIDWLIEFVATHGALAIAALMALESIFPPIPSEMIMPLAGYNAAKGDLSLAAVLLAGTFGSVAGALPWYYAGKQFGHARLKKFASAHGRWFTLSGDELDHAVEKFNEHGRKAVLFGRMVPAIRTFISIPAGLVEMRLLPFLALSTIGSFAWNCLLTAAGYLLEDKYAQVGHYMDPIAKSVLLIIVATYLYRVVTFRPQP
ncbi:DedA family protein [Massilia sp. PAMC28688]|uniref:DedA family protein n=1 Tax=Massilia sp. PAMC28688 TaxID=2861283 RepID=UPI001C62B1F9|nr:DedA family protein [Massilia sp. PAMC28688]QYF92461.1 DedA family protein [Massilia sp. PAMC28688]